MPLQGDDVTSVFSPICSSKLCVKRSSLRLTRLTGAARALNRYLGKTAFCVVATLSWQHGCGKQNCSQACFVCVCLQVRNKNANKNLEQSFRCLVHQCVLRARRNTPSLS